MHKQKMRLRAANFMPVCVSRSMITIDRNDAKRHQTDSTTTNRVCIILYVNSVLVVIWQKSNFCEAKFGDKIVGKN